MRSRASRGVSCARGTRRARRTSVASSSGSRVACPRGGKDELVGRRARVARASERARGRTDGARRAQPGAASAARDRALRAGHARRRARHRAESGGDRRGGAHARARDRAAARRAHGNRYMSPLALSGGVVTAWWIALGALLVVAVVVTLLLEIL